MLRKFVLAVILLAVLPTLALAQVGKMRGRVTDKDTGDPLIGVNITLVGTSLGAATDVNGDYIVLGVPPGTYTIRCSYIGYQEQDVSNIRISAGLTTTKDFQLQSSTIEMEALEVVAERPLVQRNTTNTVRMTTAEDIENLPFRGLQNILALNAGTVQQNGELHVRGGRDREIAYFVDGVAATNPVNNAENFTVIQEAIEEIQMQAGGYTAQFGGANSGVVTTTMKTGGPRLKTTLDFRTDDFAHAGNEFLGTTSRGFRNAVLTVGGPISSKFRFFLAGQHRYERNRTATWIEPFKFGDDPGEEVFTVDDGFSGRPKGEPLPGPIEFKKNFLPKNQRYSNQIQGTLVYNASSALKFRLSGSYQQTRLPLGHNSFYSALNNIFREVNPRWDNKTGFVGLKATHLLNATTFYEVNLNSSFNFSKTTDPFFGDDWQKYVDARAWADAGRDTSDWVNVFQGPVDRSVVFDFSLRPTNDPYNDYSKGSQTSMGASIDFTTQATKNIELKVGARADRWTMRNYRVGSPANFMSFLYGSDGTQTRTFDNDFERRVQLSNRGAIDNYGWDYLGTTKINSGPQGPKHPLFASGYVQSKFEYRDLILNLGLRYERFDYAEYRPAFFEDPARDKTNLWLDEDALVKTKAFDYLLPRVNFAFPVTDNTVFYAQYGKYVQQTRLGDIFQSVRLLSRVTMPETRSLYGFFGSTVNFEAKPERTNQYELGIRQTLTNDFAFTLTAFYKDLQDQLRLDQLLADGSGDLEAGTRLASGWVNNDFGTAKGLEMTLELRRTKRLAARVNYTLSDTRGTGSDSRSTRVAVSDATIARYPTLIYPLDYAQRHRGTVMLDYRFGRGDGGPLQGLGVNALLTFNSGHAYTLVNEPHNLGQANPWTVGTRATADPRGRNPVEPINSSTTPWNFNVDLNVDKMFYFNKFNVKVYAIVLNLINTKNIINVYQTTGRDDDDGWLKSPLAAQYVAKDGYESFYRAINLQNGWGWRWATGTNLWSAPRQIHFGFTLEFF